MNSAIAVKGAGNPSPVWEKGRDEGLPYPKRVQRHYLVSIISGGPSPRPLSHPGEGFPAHARTFTDYWTNEHGAPNGTLR
jgi:hypothetical protein